MLSIINWILSWFGYQQELKIKEIKVHGEISDIMNKYPDRLPIIVNRKSENLPPIGKNKFLVPKHIKVCDFTKVVKKRLSLSPEEILYLSCNGVKLDNNLIIENIYNEMKNEDKYLILEYYN